MKRTFKLLSLSIIPILYMSESKAQIFDEWEARPNVSLKYKFNKKLSVSTTYYLYMDKNMSEYNKSVISGDVGYKVNSWMKLGLDYRRGITPKKQYNDIRYSVTFDYNPSKNWKLEYRPMIQQKSFFEKKAHQEDIPTEYFMRNRITVTYKFVSDWEVYAFTENYQQLNKGMTFHRQKSALGTEYKISPRNKIGARFEVLNKKSGKMIARPNLSYTYTLGYVKQKTK